MKLSRCQVLVVPVPDDAGEAAVDNRAAGAVAPVDFDDEDSRHMGYTRNKPILVPHQYRRSQQSEKDSSFA
jgi:hypothetical protein